MITKRHLLLLLPALALATLVSSAQTKSVPDAIESYVKPYVDSMNFSGVVLVREDDKVIFEKSYGFANREQQKKNTAETHSILHPSLCNSPRPLCCGWWTQVSSS